MRKNNTRTWEQQIRIDQQNGYDEMHTEQIKLKLNRKTDADVLDWLRKQQWKKGKSMQGEIKRLIREEIARETAKSRRCTPTENEGASSGAVLKSATQTDEYLSRPDVKEYLKKYPDATEVEKQALAQWLKDGYSFLDNGYFLTDDSGYPLDFIQGERMLPHMQEAFMNSLGT